MPKRRLNTDGIQDKMTATAAFQELLKSLCLTEFPCGIGSWRSCSGQFADEHYSTTTKDYDVQKEKIEVLDEFLYSGTWDADTSWSKEAAGLRRLSVSDPSKIDEDFIWRQFETLRLIDKEIEELDDGLKKLINLRELTLSVNKLKRVPADYLPSKLKVLELCYNELDSISSLAKHPHALIHLGLSYNRLAHSQEYKYFTADYWPALLSLDLGYNDFVDLVGLVVKLSTIPNLQNLVLIGNPLSLVPGYRGHVVDAMKNLMILDDIRVTADERHHFKGLGKKKELILEEAQLVVELGDISGIPMHEDLKNMDQRPDFPIISVQYRVEYDMLPDGYLSERSKTERHTSASCHNDESLVDETGSENGLLVNVSPNNATQNIAWNEEAMQLQYRKVHFSDDLIRLRDCLKHGISFTIYEERICQWPATPTGEEETVRATPNNKKGKVDATDKNTPTKTAKSKDKGSDKEKAKKNVQEVPSNLKSDPPEITEIGRCHVPLSHFVDGDSEYFNICHCGGGPMPAVTIDEGFANNQMKPDSSKPVHEKITEKKPLTGEVKNKSGKVTPKKGTKGAEKGNPSTTPHSNANDGDLQLPAPITLSVKLELVRWKTAADSLKPLSN